MKEHIHIIILHIISKWIEIRVSLVHIKIIKGPSTILNTHYTQKTVGKLKAVKRNNCLTYWSCIFKFGSLSTISKEYINNGELDQRILIT